MSSGQQQHHAQLYVERLYQYVNEQRHDI